MNYQLYRMSMKTILLPYKKKRSMFTTATGYIYNYILNNDADFVINIDEDAFVIDNDRLMKLLDYVKDNNYINCGMPDGGVVEIRQHNPLVTNPFFNILNVKEIRKKFNLEEINNNYSSHKTEFENFSTTHLKNDKYKFDFYEPYYPFFIWLTVNFKTLFLNATVHKDGISTVLKDHLDQPFLVHSWYSRYYGKDTNHTKRINSLFKQETGNSIPKLSGYSKLVILFEKIENIIFFNIILRVKNKFFKRSNY